MIKPLPMLSIILFFALLVRCSPEFDNVYDPRGEKRLEPGITADPSSLTLVENGSPGTINFWLTSKPYSNVTLDLSTGMPEELLIEPSSVTFTSLNYNVKVKVRISAADDDITDDQKLFTLTPAPLASSDSGYSGLKVQDINILVIDNDRRPIGYPQSPFINQKGVSTYQQISVIFDKDMDADTINSDTFKVTHPFHGRVSGNIFYYPQKKMAVFQPKEYLRWNSGYKASLSTGIADIFGNSMLDELSWSFKVKEFDSSPAASVMTTEYAMAVQAAGNYACVVYSYWDNGVGHRRGGVQIVDITNPVKPSIKGSVLTDGMAYDLDISGNYAYLIVWKGSSPGPACGLRIVDISNPASPSITGTVDTPRDPLDIKVSGGYAYIADGGAGGLLAIDVSDPGNPFITGSCPTEGAAHEIQVSGQYAYIADGQKGMQILDISDPADPFIAKSFYIDEWSYGIHITGKYAYIAEPYSGVQVIDITDPLNPFIKRIIQTPVYDEKWVYASGDYLYVNDDQGGNPCIIDNSDTENPLIAGSIQVPGPSMGLHVSGEHIYIADHYNGLQIFKTPDSEAPSVISGVTTLAPPNEVHVSGPYAYMADENNGLLITDISDPENPYIAAVVETTGYPYGVYVSGDYAYVADGDAGLQIIDISDPENAFITGSAATYYWAYSVYVSGNYAYVADGDSGLQIIDVSDPKNPFICGNAAATYSSIKAHVSGNFAYVADSNASLQIIDVSDPENPEISGIFDASGTGASFSDVKVSGNYAYITASHMGLYIIDVSNPEYPEIADIFDTGGYALGVILSGRYAYVANSSGGDRFGGLSIIDISDPLNPVAAGNLETNDIYKIHVAGSYAYVVHQDGLSVIFLGKYQR